MVASAKVYTSNTAQTQKDQEHKFIQMGLGGVAEGYWNENGEYIKPQSAPDFYIGASTDPQGNGEINYKVEYGPAGYDSQNGVYLNPNSEIFQPTPKQQTNSSTKATGGYSRTTAKTASDIAQGGMTKKEVQEFNIKHPNETALRRA